MLIDSPTKESYNDQLIKLQIMAQARVIQYLETTWLPHKDSLSMHECTILIISGTFQRPGCSVHMLHSKSELLYLQVSLQYIRKYVVNLLSSIILMGMSAVVARYYLASGDGVRDKN